MDSEILSVTKARSRLAHLFMFGRIPTPAVEAAARADLATAKIARAIGESMASTKSPLTDDQIVKLLDLLLALNDAESRILIATVGRVRPAKAGL